MDNELARILRRRADAVFETSNTMLLVAQNLLKQGNQREADRLRDEAQAKRNESILLMDKARAIEGRQSNVLQFRSRSPIEKRDRGAPLKSDERRRFSSDVTHLRKVSS